jgi:hypothetical protein
VKLQRKIGKHNVVVTCASDLVAQAEGLLDKIEELNHRVPIRDGTTIEFGWSLLTLRDFGEELSVCEPYFRGDPFQDEMPVVEDTLRVLTQQIGLLNRLGVEGFASHFQQKIVIEKGIFACAHIFLERQITEDPDDSGWYIGNAEGGEVQKSIEDLEKVYVYELFNNRPSVMAVLALPVGYQVIFFGDNIEAIFNIVGEDVWATSLGNKI